MESVLYDRERSTSESSDDKENINFLKAIYLVFIVAPQAVKRLFLTKHPDKTVLTQQLREKKSELERTNGFPKQKKSQLFPDPGVVNPEEFDIPLLVFLLKNFTQIPPPTNGWNSDPLPIDNSEAADLLRIRRIRNELAHNQSGALEESRFECMWKDTEIILQRIGKGMFIQEIEKIKTLSDENVKGQMHHIEEIMEAIREPVPFHIRDQIKDEVEEWITEDEMFHETKFAKSVYRAAKETNFLLILGNPGSGKTVTMRHVALKLWAEGFDIVPIVTPTDIKKYHVEGKKQLFLVDDCMGVHFLDTSRLQDWETLKKDLIKWRIYTEENIEMSNTFSKDYQNKRNDPKEKQTSKILATSRLFLTRLEEFSSFLSKLECVNNQDEDHFLDYSERKEIFKKLFKNLKRNVNICENCPISETCAMRFDSFPLLCRMCAQLNFDPENFFEFPFRYFHEEIDKIYHQNKEIYFVLIFCLVLKCKFPQKEETGKLEAFEALLDKCHLQRGASHDLIRDRIKVLKGSYLFTSSDNELEFAHVTIRDIIAFHFCSKSGFSILAKHASDSFIRERVRPNGRLDIDNPYDEFFIILNAEDQSRYIERVCKDLTEKDWLITFRCPFLPDAHLESLIYRRFNEMEKLHVLTKCKNKYQNEKKISIFDHYNYLSSLLDGFTFKETFRDIHHLREELLRPLPFIFWSIGFGWFEMFNFLYKKTKSKIRSNIEKSRHAALVLSALGGNEEMTKHIDTCIAKFNSMCFFCNSSSIFTQMFVHHNDCAIKNLSSFTIACITGNISLTKYLEKRLSFHPKSIFDISTLNNVRWIPRILDSGPLQPIKFSAIDIACTLGHSSIVEHFLQETSMSLVGRVNHLSLACVKGHAEVANILLRNISDEDMMKDNMKQITESLLVYSSFKGFDSLVMMFLNKKVLVDARDEKMRTPLLAACENGHKTIIEMLISKHANVNNYDIFGWTPLKIACAKGYVEIVKLLLACKDISFDDPNFDHCSEKEEDLVNQGLAEIGEEIQHFGHRYKGAESLLLPVGYGVFPLFLACYNGHDEIVEILVRKGATINRPCKGVGNNTPLTAAYYRFYPKVLNVLISHIDMNKYKKATYDPKEIDRPIVPLSFFLETRNFTFVKQDPLETERICMDKNLRFLL